MPTSRILFVVILISIIARVEAQGNATPAPAAEPAQTEMQKWIATTDAQWQATFNRDVVDAHAAELKKLVAQYAVSLETALTKASAAGDLDGALALRNEQKRFTETQVFPERDEAADPASVKQIRAATRIQLARVEKENAIRTKALHAKYDAILAQAQTQLTQAKRLDDALLVKAKRDEVAAAWSMPAVAAAAEKANPSATAPGTPVTGGTKTSPLPAQSETVSMPEGSLREKLNHTTWVWNGSERITFLPGGKGRWSVNNKDAFTWHIVSETKRTIEGKSPAGHAYTMTLDPSLESGRLLEANEAERATRRMESPAAPQKTVLSAKDAQMAEDVAKRLIGTKWNWFSSETLTFRSGGKAQWNWNKATGIWPWKVTSVEPVVIEGENVRMSRKFTMTLESDLKTGTIVESNGEGPRKTRNITKE